MLDPHHPYNAPHYYLQKYFAFLSFLKFQRLDLKHPDTRATTSLSGALPEPNIFIVSLLDMKHKKNWSEIIDTSQKYVVTTSKILYLEAKSGHNHQYVEK